MISLFGFGFSVAKIRHKFLIPVFFETYVDE